MLQTFFLYCLKKGKWNSAGCLKEEDITCKVKKQEHEENEGEGEMSETREEENKIVITTKDTTIVVHYR